jgi:hypothetical protein
MGFADYIKPNDAKALPLPAALVNRGASRVLHRPRSG